MINKNKIYGLALTALMMGVTINIFAQEEEPIKKETYDPARDTTEVVESHDSTFNDDRGIIWKSKDGNSEVNIRLATMFGIGVSTVLYEGGFSLPADLDYFSQEMGKSTHVKWDIIRHRLGGKKNNVSLEYGLALSYHNYAFTNPTRFTTGASQVTPVVESGVSYKKNKLKANFLEVPLMLSLLGNKEKDHRGLNLLVGGYAGILLKSKQKFKGPNGKEKVKDDFNFNKFRYGLQGMIGYGHVNLYMQYSMVDLFKEGEGPQLTPINIGVVLAGF